MRWSWWSVLRLGALLGALLGLVLAVGPLAGVGRRLEDAALATRGRDEVEAPFVVGALDDEVVADWGYPTSAWGARYADEAERLLRSGARGVVIDVMLLAGASETNLPLADLIGRSSGRVVMGYRFDRTGRGLGPDGLLGLALAGEKESRGFMNLPDEQDGVPRRGFGTPGGRLSLAAAAARRAGAGRSFPTEFRADLLRWRVPAYRLTRLLASDVRGKVVLVGFTDAASDDYKPYPAGPERAGVEIQARHAATLWAGSEIRELSRAGWGVLALGIVVLTVMAAGSWAAGSLLTASAFLVTVFAWRIGWAAPVLSVTLAPLIGTAGAALARGIVAARERGRIADAFATQLSSAALTEMMERGVAGRSTEGTVMFVDVRGSSELAAKGTPEGSFAALNALFARLVPIVEAHGGVVHGFMGDGFVATFGALVALERDALAAIDTAGEMVGGAREGELRFGIGLNRGRFLLGNIGSTRRAQFTIIGHTVNVAARTEKATKGIAPVLATEAVAREVPRERLGEPVTVSLDGMGRIELWPLAPDGADSAAHHGSSMR